MKRKTFTNEEAKIIKNLFKKEFGIIDFDFDNRLFIQYQKDKIFRIMMLPLEAA